MAELSQLQKVMGVRFKHRALLEQALTHTSYANEMPACIGSNEKLEFLGDAVLGLVTAEELHRGYPHLSEGEMTRLRAAIVRRETLARAAAGLSVGDYLYLGKGEEASGGRGNATNLASAFEALTAAIFLDRGFVTARDFVMRVLGVEMERVFRQGAVVDYKSQLQEMTQARFQTVPAYHLLEATGPSHDRTFTVEVRVGESLLGCGAGKSKKLAETEAARLALERLPIFTSQSPSAKL